LDMRQSYNSRLQNVKKNGSTFQHLENLYT